MQLPKSNTLGYLTGNIPGYMFATMKTNTLADRLKHAMELRKISQAALAEAAEMSQPSVWKITSGRSKSSRKLVDIAKVLGVRPEWLANGQGDMTDEEGGNKSSQERMDVVPGEIVYKSVNVVTIWDGNGPTNAVTMAPDLINPEHVRAYKLKYETGYDEFPSGSMVYVDTHEKPGGRDYVLADIHGTISVYRYSSSGNGALLDADHRVDPMPLSEEVKIIGVIVFVLRGFRQ